MKYLVIHSPRTDKFWAFIYSFSDNYKTIYPDDGGYGLKLADCDFEFLSDGVSGKDCDYLNIPQDTDIHWDVEKEEYERESFNSIGEAKRYLIKVSLEYEI